MNQKHALWNFLIGAGPILLGCVTILSAIAIQAHPMAYLGLPVALCAAGLALFLHAKSSVIVRGHLFTFGPALMTRHNRRLYKLGYALMGSAAILSLPFVQSL